MYNVYSCHLYSMLGFNIVTCGLCELKCPLGSKSLINYNDAIATKQWKV